MQNENQFINIYFQDYFYNIKPINEKMRIINSYSRHQGLNIMIEQQYYLTQSLIQKNILIINQIVMLNKKEQEIIKSKLKTEQKTMTLHQIKTDLTNLGKICLNSGLKMEFGKPVKLPLIKKKKQESQKTQQQCYSSRSNQNNSQINIKNDFRQTTLEDDKLQKNNYNIRNDRSNSFLNKFIDQENFKYSLKEKSLDTTKINIQGVEESHLIQNREQKNSIKKCFPKIFRYKYFKDARDTNQKIERIKSQRNVIKMQSIENIPKYKLGNLLGQGSYATVRIAKSINNQLFAVKTYEKSKIKDTEKIQNIRRQIQILQKIKHPNIIKFIQVIQTSFSINIVTELIQNISLYEYLKSKNGNKINELQAKFIFRQIVHAVNYLHSIDIAHRDIKLQNILITKDNHIKLIDFGFSTGEIVHKVNIFCGTPSYISPQMISKKGYYAKPTDVWSCGIVLYKMLCGSFPFKGLNEKTLYTKISKGYFRITSQISLNAQILLNKMLAMDPNSRITMQEIMDENWFKEKMNETIIQ